MPSPTIVELVDELAHFLPQQAPLHTFVHHNTLHAFEHLPFDAAVVAAGKLYGAEPYQSESAFAAHLKSGRILSVDLDSVVAADELQHPELAETVVANVTDSDYRRIRLRHLFEVPWGPALAWRLGETSERRELHEMVDASRQRELLEWANRRCGALPPKQRVAAMLESLWGTLAAQAPVPSPGEHKPGRRRDELLAAGYDDVDQRIQPLLIRLSAAFLDQGVALWSMPGRERGFLKAVRSLYAQTAPSPEPWARGLAEEFARQERAGLDAEGAIQHALQELEVAESQWRDYLLASMLSLPGWAGMMCQFEQRPDRAPVEPRPARLIDFVAVLLTFEALASRHELSRRLGHSARFSILAGMRPVELEHQRVQLIYEAFLMAQVVAIDLEEFDRPENAVAWLQTVRKFDEIERRRLLHQAYERRLRCVALDAISAHTSNPAKDPPPCTLQAIFCIDDRECSTRRHLEESYPQAQTFGFAGFFGVAMAWQGLGEVRSRPLCPVNVTPQHYITERALDRSEEEVFLATRRRRGLRAQVFGNASREMARGGLLSAFFGVFSVAAMVGYCLFPRAAEGFKRAMARRKMREPETRLMLERVADQRTAEGLWIGYSVPEMADIVANALRAMRLVDGFSEIVLAVGHGSSSVNNPHGSAYDCGATGGGRGGPNARAFAAMANHPGVRAILAERAIEIPAGTWFVGCYHNTCDDSMVYYDEDLMPDERIPALDAAKAAMQTACALESHERCRRFASAPRTADITATMRHAQHRSMDLAQPRPECGHATNAYAIIGRRERTRGLFLDRRAFLVSYDPTSDSDGAILASLLAAVVPVGAGINLEYYFSFVDPVAYGCGSKLPHNITGLFAVMDGHSSDLRTGLPWQMVEIHEPVRLLTVIECEIPLLVKVMDGDPEVARLVTNEWLQVVVLDPTSSEMHEFVHGEFRRYEPSSRVLPKVSSSAEFYKGQIHSLGCAATTGSSGSAARRVRNTGDLEGAR